MPLYLDNTCLHVYVKCTHRHDSPAADEQPNNKRQQENVEPRPRLRLENQTGPLSGEHVLLVFHLSVTSFPRRVPFFFHAVDSQARQFDIQLRDIQSAVTFRIFLYYDIVPESMLFCIEKLNKRNA